MIDIEAKIKFQRSFQCAECGASAPGETRSVQLRLGSVGSLSETLQQHLKVTTNDFPVNWGAYPNNRFICTECIHHGRLG